MSNTRTNSKSIEKLDSNESLAAETPIKVPTYSGPVITLKREEELKKQSNLMLNMISSSSLSKAPYREISPRDRLSSSLSGW